MKILFITNVPAPYRVEFFNELGKMCDLTVLYEVGHATDRNEKWKSGNTENFREIFMNGKRVNSDSAICFSVIKYLRDSSYDIIVIGGYSTPTGMLAIEYLRYKKNKFILNSDGGFIKSDGRLKYLIKKHYIKSASAWLSTGKKTNDYLTYYGAEKKNIYIYPFTSVNSDYVINEPISFEEKLNYRKMLGINEEYVIISVGQFIPRKGFDVLIEAMRGLPSNFGVYIIGGEPTEEYKKLKVNYNLSNLHFEGFKTKKELVKYYQSGDVFVLPTREDIWGLVVNEAMANGLPVITTDKCVSGLELIDDWYNGVIVPVDDVNALTNSIKKILLDEGKRLSMCENSLKKIKKYTIDSMAKEHIQIFQSYMSNVKDNKN